MFSSRSARISNRRQEVSSEPVPKALPSGKNWMALMSDSWPANVCTASPHTEGSFGEDLRHALVDRPPPSRVSFAGRKAHHLGCLHHQQSSRHPPALIVGYDLCVRAQWKLRRLWWSGQHLFHLQLVVARRPYSGCARAIWSLRLPLLLPIHQ